MIEKIIVLTFVTVVFLFWKGNKKIRPLVMFIMVYAIYVGIIMLYDPFIVLISAISGLFVGLSIGMALQK